MYIITNNAAEIMNRGKLSSIKRRSCPINVSIAIEGIFPTAVTIKKSKNFILDNAAAKVMMPEGINGVNRANIKKRQLPFTTNTIQSLQPAPMLLQLRI
jgi:hypothetical protein